MADRAQMTTSTRVSRIEVPDEGHVLRALTFAVGDDADAIWSGACTAVGLDPPAASTTEVHRALAALSRDAHGIARVVALSQLVRLRTALAATRTEERQ